MRAFFVFLSLTLAIASEAAVISGNGNSANGGVVGSGSLEITESSGNFSATFTRGTSSFSDALVLYIDSVAGGFNDTTTFVDDSTYLRGAASGRALVGSDINVFFPTGFEADYAIAFSPNADAQAGSLFQLQAGGNLSFVTSVNLSPNTNETAATYAFDFTDTNIGGSSSFNFVGTYINPQFGFRSDEAFGAGIASGAGGTDNITFSGFETISSVPEPSSALLLSVVAIPAFERWRRKRNASKS